MNSVQKTVNPKTAISLIWGVSVIAWCMILLITDTPLILNWKAFKQLPTVLTVDMFLFGLFVRWGWKWKGFQNWLVLFPDLNGKWKGNLKSLWKNQDVGKTTSDIEATLSIKQTFLGIHCNLKTEESDSNSYSASFLINPDTGQKRLIYNYFNKPRPTVRERSVPHDGTVLLNIMKEADTIKLEGEYWTSRATSGEVEFVKE